MRQLSSKMRTPLRVQSPLAISCMNLVTERVRRVFDEPVDIANAPLITYRDDRSINQVDKIFGVEEVAHSVSYSNLIRLLCCT